MRQCAKAPYQCGEYVQYKQEVREKLLKERSKSALEPREVARLELRRESDAPLA
jgi:hypothetical protein